MRSSLALVLPALALGLSACVSVVQRSAAPVPPAAAEVRAPVTILVSIDGFRPDYLSREATPVLHALAASGAQASMRPSFPTMTFPNHHTLVTGLRPDRHGVIENTMEDPARPGVQFKLSDAAQVRDRFWWDDAEPIWVTAERAGVRTATMFWPGSEADIRGVRPSVWIPYAAAITSDQRVTFVLDWLRRPTAERPRLLTLYFDVVDKRSHEQGFDSPEKAVAIREVDAALGRLREGLAALGQPANLVIVSDHGMAPVPLDHRIEPASIVSPEQGRVIAGGPLLYAFPKPGQEAALAKRVPGRHGPVQCWRREELPARFHFGRHRRVPPYVCLADMGWRFNVGSASKLPKGDHGFDPASPEMRALFIANGPAFRPGVTLQPFDNVSVAPLLRELIGLPPGQGLDGTVAPFDTALRR